MADDTDAFLARVSRTRLPVVDDHSRGRGLKLLQLRASPGASAGSSTGRNSSVLRQQKRRAPPLPPLATRAVDCACSPSGGPSSPAKLTRRSMPDVSFGSPVHAPVKAPVRDTAEEFALSARILLAPRGLPQQPTSRVCSAPSLRCARRHSMPTPAAAQRIHSAGEMPPSHAPSRIPLPQHRMRGPPLLPAAPAAAGSATARPFARPPRLNPINYAEADEAEAMDTSSSDQTPGTLSPEPLRSDFSPPVARPPGARPKSDFGAAAAELPPAEYGYETSDVSQPGSLHCSLDAQLAQTESHAAAGGQLATSSRRISLCFDPQLNCYFDPITHKYFELML